MGALDRSRISNSGGTSPITFSKNEAELCGNGKQRQRQYALNPLFSAVRETVEETEKTASIDSKCRRKYSSATSRSSSTSKPSRFNRAASFFSAGCGR